MPPSSVESPEVSLFCLFSFVLLFLIPKMGQNIAFCSSPSSFSAFFVLFPLFLLLLLCLLHAFIRYEKVTVYIIKYDLTVILL